jgi:hypothetical protein
LRRYNLASGIRSQSQLAQGMLAEDIPVGVVDPENISGLSDQVKSDFGKGKTLMKKVVDRLAQSKRELDDTVRAREVVRIRFEAEEELRVKAERDMYEEKLRNERQAVDVKCAEEATRTALKETKRLEAAEKKLDGLLEETRKALLAEQNVVAAMKVQYNDYDETKTKNDKQGQQLERTRVDLATCKEQKAGTPTTAIGFRV